jgi:hypothetical protein
LPPCVQHSLPVPFTFRMIMLMTCGKVYKLWKSWLCSFLPIPVTACPLHKDYSHNLPILKRSQYMFFPLCEGQSFTATQMCRSRLTLRSCLSGMNVYSP